MDVIYKLVAKNTRDVNWSLMWRRYASVLQRVFQLTSASNGHSLCPAMVTGLNDDSLRAFNQKHKSLIDDIMTDGMLLAVQKKRRTVEKRLVRRFGVERYPQECGIIRAKENLVVCDHCGHYHELHTICGHCYNKVREESSKIMEKIRQHFKFNEPIEEEVRIRYDDDQSHADGQPSDRKPVVEMEGKRPEWFAKNLLSRSVSDKWVEKKPIVGNQELKLSRE